MMESSAHLDAADELAAFREQFCIPPGPDGKPCAYLCGHSLGLQPKRARELVAQELDDWARLGVEGHFRGKNPWYPYHEQFRKPLARLVGALPTEVVAMNGLSVNLHLMLTSFYRPTAGRFRIVTDGPPFPSDLYAFQSQNRIHGLDPEQALTLVQSPQADATIDEADIERQIGADVAVVVINGVNYLTGQRFDIERIVKAGHAAGCIVGVDLAHAAGNVPLKLHDWNVDFAVWCSYKYLNAGPGAVGGCFVHERHAKNRDLPRFAGWWGNDPATRFRMHLEAEFLPVQSADAWQLSNPPVLSLAPLRASLDLFDAATLPKLRAKSEKLTEYFQTLLDGMPNGVCQQITPREPERRGAMLALRLPNKAREVHRKLEAAGVHCDFREPDVIRAAPVPLYNSFSDVWRFVNVLQESL